MTDVISINDFSTTRDALEWGENYLKSPTIESPLIEARALLSGLLDCSFTQLYLDLDQRLAPEFIQLFRSAIDRRKKNEPVAYILGKKNFLGRDFFVDPSVLIPRPETELLVDMVAQLARVKNLLGAKILDIGTGSGCVAVSMNLELPESEVVGCDISSQALALARRNAEFLKAPKISFFESDLTANLPPEKKGDFDIILSNPPYITRSELSALDPDLGFEPILALDGGPAGLDVIHPLVRQARAWLKMNGLLVLEIGYQQGAAVKQIFEANGYQNVLVLKDFQGHDRLIKGEWCGSI